MRAVWSLIVLCLLAVGGPRPERRTAEDAASSQLRAAHDGLPILAARSHDQGLDARHRDGAAPAIVGAAPALPPSPRAALLPRAAAPAAPAPAFAPTRSSRGPPLA